MEIKIIKKQGGIEAIPNAKHLPMALVQKLYNKGNSQTFAESMIEHVKERYPYLELIEVTEYHKKFSKYKWVTILFKFQKDYIPPVPIHRSYSIF